MQTLLNLLAAIALLVWGTHIVRTGVLRVYGTSLRQVLRRNVGNRGTGFVAGVAVTGLLQSSTATRSVAPSPLSGPLSPSSTDENPTRAAAHPMKPICVRFVEGGSRRAFIR